MTIQLTTEAVWRRLSEDLRQFIRIRVNDDNVAEDLLQETFLRIHRRLTTLKQSNRLTSWVYRIASNVIRDHYRRTADTPVGLEDFHASNRPDAEDPGIPAAAPWLEEMVDQLPEIYRIAVKLAEIENVSQREVARKLGLSLSGAKSRVQRGRTLLKGILESCCTFDFDRRGNLLACDPQAGRGCNACEE